jgi:hypothetical protein
MNYIGPKTFKPFIRFAQDQFFPEHTDSRYDSPTIIVGPIAEITHANGCTQIIGDEEYNDRIDELYSYTFDRIMYYPESLIGSDNMPKKTRESIKELIQLCQIGNIVDNGIMSYEFLLDAILINPQIIQGYITNKLTEDSTCIDAYPLFWSSPGELSIKQPIDHYASLNEEWITPGIAEMNSLDTIMFLLPMNLGNYYVQCHTQWNLGDSHAYSESRKILAESDFTYKQMPGLSYTKAIYNHLFRHGLLEKFEEEQIKRTNTGHNDMMFMLSSLYSHLICPSAMNSYIKTPISPNIVFFFAREFNTKGFHQVLSAVKKKQDKAYKEYKHVFELFDYDSIMIQKE